MALDQNAADTWLKEKPHRDLTLRVISWIAISLASAYFAWRKGVAPLASLNALAKSTGPLVNAVGTLAILLALVALFFKDMEVADGDRFGESTRWSWYGGWVRRVAGDLMLWTLGAMISLLSVAIVVAAATPVTLAERDTIVSFFILLLILISVTGYLTHMVRRRGASIMRLLVSTPKQIVLAYGTALVLVFFVVSLFK